MVDAKLRVGTLIGIRDAVVAGLGLGLLPEFVVVSALSARTLRVVLPRAKLRPVTVHALYRTELRGSRRIQAVIAHLRATMPLAELSVYRLPRIRAYERLRSAWS